MGKIVLSSKQIEQLKIIRKQMDLKQKEAVKQCVLNWSKTS